MVLCACLSLPSIQGCSATFAQLGADLLPGRSCLQGQDQPFSLVSQYGVQQKMQDSLEDLTLGLYIIKASLAVYLMSREGNVGRRPPVSTSMVTIASNCAYLGSRGLWLVFVRSEVMSVLVTFPFH